MKVKFTREELTALTNMYEEYARLVNPSRNQAWVLHDVLQLMRDMWDRYDKEKEKK